MALWGKIEGWLKLSGEATAGTLIKRQIDLLKTKHQCYLEGLWGDEIIDNPKVFMERLLARHSTQTLRSSDSDLQLTCMYLDDDYCQFGIYHKEDYAEKILTKYFTLNISAYSRGWDTPEIWRWFKLFIRDLKRTTNFKVDGYHLLFSGGSLPTLLVDSNYGAKLLFERRDNL